MPTPGVLPRALAGIVLACVCGFAGAGDPAAGRNRAQACAPCHGPLGVSTLPNAPHLAGQPEAYLAQQLRAYRSGARKDETMSVAARSLSDADIADLAAWFAAIEIRVDMPARMKP